MEKGEDQREYELSCVTGCKSGSEGSWGCQGGGYEWKTTSEGGGGGGGGGGED